jgi:hypothetical protein
MQQLQIHKERHMYKFTTSTLLTPKAGATNEYIAGIKAGSALAAVPLSDNMVALYYEGNTNDACNLHDMQERIYCAAGRALTKYPTIAVNYMPESAIAELFDVVGSVDVVGERMQINVTNKPLLDAWASQYKPR